MEVISLVFLGVGTLSRPVNKISNIFPLMLNSMMARAEQSSIAVAVVMAVSVAARAFSGNDEVCGIN